jgi:hypothetical protein
MPVAHIADFLVEEPCPGDGLTVNRHNQAAGCAGEGEAEVGFFWVPDNVIEQCGEVLDIVEPASQRSNCFTRTYSRYTKARSFVPPLAHSPSSIAMGPFKAHIPC